MAAREYSVQFQKYVTIHPPIHPVSLRCLPSAAEFRQSISGTEHQGFTPHHGHGPDRACRRRRGDARFVRNGPINSHANITYNSNHFNPGTLSDTDKKKPEADISGVDVFQGKPLERPPAERFPPRTPPPISRPPIDRRRPAGRIRRLRSSAETLADRPAAYRISAQAAGSGTSTQTARP